MTDDEGSRLTTRVCVAGGGPAGVMLGLLLARAGIDVVVLEQHADFFRDFRGDTVHPSTLDLIDQLGFRQAFEAVPHTRLRTLDAVVGTMRLHLVDFGRLRGHNHEIALMPQWDLLDLLASEGRRYSGFRLVMGAEVTDVVRSGGRVTGVVAQTADGELRVDATFTVAADGRHSTVRDRLRLKADGHRHPDRRAVVAAASADRSAARHASPTSASRRWSSPSRGRTTSSAAS